jgi:hypothetical protein
MSRGLRRPTQRPPCPRWKRDAAALWALGQSKADKHSIEQYKGIYSKLLRATDAAHHDFARTVEFRRSEAWFIVRLTENMLALAGDLTTTTS